MWAMRFVVALVCFVLAGPAPAFAKKAKKKSPATVEGQISAALDGRLPGLQDCAIEGAFNHGAKVVELSASLMINNAGQVMGCTVTATADGKPHPAVAACTEGVLKAAPYPKSRSALITVSRTWKFSQN